MLNLVLTELLVCLYGIPVDMVASMQSGWVMGKKMCVATGFILTVLGRYAGHNAYFNTFSSLLLLHLSIIDLNVVAGMNSIHNLTCVAIFRWLFISVNTDGYYWDTVEAHKHNAVYKCLILSLRF